MAAAPATSNRLPRRRSRSALLLAGLVLAVMLVALPTAPAMSEAKKTEPPPAPTPPSLIGVLQQSKDTPWVQAVVRSLAIGILPFRGSKQAKLKGQGFDVDVAGTDLEAWQVTVSESGGSGTSARASKLRGGPLAYSLNYDSKSSRATPALRDVPGINSVRFSAAGLQGTMNDSDWHLAVDGDTGNHLHMTADGDSLVYDASLVAEVPMETVKGLSALYALDFKRRVDLKEKFNAVTGDYNLQALAPNWMRNSVGLRYDTKYGNVKMNMHQREPDSGARGGFDYEAVYKVTGTGTPGRPEYLLRSSQEGTKPAVHNAKVRLQGPPGLAGGVEVNVREGKTVINGYGEIEKSAKVAKGVSLDADTKVVATPAAKQGQELLTILPINVKAKVSLDELAPDVAGPGSEVALTARYKIGAEKPALGASMKYKTVGRLDGSVEGQTTFSDAGELSSGTLKVSGALGPARAMYAATKTAGASGALRQHGEVVWKAPDFMQQPPGTAVFARMTQSPADHEGKPRLRVGLTYDTGRLSGEDVAFDSAGSEGQMLLADGRPWFDANLQRARNSAEIVRRRVKSADGAGYRWLHK